MANQPKKRKPGRPKLDDSIHTMQLILQTAAQLFMTQGYEKVSLDSVASACQLTKASLYYYFQNKSELFTQCVVNVLSFANAQTQKILNGEGTIQQKLKLAAIGRMRNAEVEFETMMREVAPHLSEEQIKRIRSTEETIYESIAAALSKAIENGEIRPCNPVLVTHLYTSMLMIRNRKHFMDIVQTVEEAANELVELIFEGLKPE
ncbi:TetR/AcrR family transcriptional regulator [Paenibacillus sp. IITD108]|uniref:TetR/AcrR family transcriptional regulator n=1 Tax=Paenibacillus sp. IITD108 TaxID=3116649 RepID=UPI002F427A7C